mmetsp:Transcript_8114/g.20751  ORF Transcript_8114/g.20751 Transcript_8114/m.20751 type:complete len:282 (+) Transcript_8114:99-944(+)
MLKSLVDGLFATLASWNAAGGLREHGASYTAVQWVPTAADASATEQHALWTACLQRHTSGATIRGVRTSVVDYAALDADPQFGEYLTQLAEMRTPSNPAEHLTFLLNGYNALCAKVVSSAVASGKLLGADASIRDLGGVWRPIWKQPVGTLAGEVVSLDGIEHGHVRSIFQDARVHACLNCASVSCPDLASKAFEARTLDAAMDKRVSIWLSNDTKGFSHLRDGPITLSAIFRWYEKDFLTEMPVGGDILDWLRTHRCPAFEGQPTLEYAPYDWGVNRPPS